LARRIALQTVRNGQEKRGTYDTAACIAIVQVGCKIDADTVARRQANGAHCDRSAKKTTGSKNVAHAGTAETETVVDVTRQAWLWSRTEMSVMDTDRSTVTLTLGTVAMVTVVVGAGSEGHSRAVEMRLQTNGTDAPARPPAAEALVVVGIGIGLLFDPQRVDHERNVVAHVVGHDDQRLGAQGQGEKREEAVCGHCESVLGLRITIELRLCEKKGETHRLRQQFGYQ
jgi:hypothetical protein